MTSDEHSRVSGREYVVSLLAESFLCSDLALSYARSWICEESSLAVALHVKPI